MRGRTAARCAKRLVKAVVLLLCGALVMPPMALTESSALREAWRRALQLQVPQRAQHRGGGGAGTPVAR